jgi:uncharacterized protein (TIGR00290 family)
VSGEGDPPGPSAVVWSGGKDSTLALHRALRRGRRVTHLFTIYDRPSGRVPYHGVSRDLVAAQARALGLEPVLEGCEEGGFEDALARGFERLAEAGVESLVFGNIHLADVRAWYEERVRAAGFEHVEPLWGGEPARLVREFVSLGYRGVVVSVMLGTADPTWLGREFGGELLAEIARHEEIDPCGERGEFHSFTWDGPLFTEPVPVRPGEEHERNGYRYLDLEIAEPTGRAGAGGGE